MKHLTFALLLVFSPLAASALDTHPAPPPYAAETVTTLEADNLIAVRIPHVMFLQIRSDKSAIIANNRGASGVAIDRQSCRLDQ